MANQLAQRISIPLESGINLAENRSEVKNFSGFVKKNGIMYNDALSPFKYEIDEDTRYFPLENGGKITLDGYTLKDDSGKTVANFQGRGFGKARFAPVWLNKDTKGFDKKDDAWCYVSQSGVVDFTINVFKNNSVTLTKSVQIFGNVAHVKFYKAKDGRWLCFVYCVLSSLSRVLYVCDIGESEIAVAEKVITAKLTNLVNIGVAEFDDSNDVYFSVFSKSVNGYESKVLYYSGCYTESDVLDVTYAGDNSYNMFDPHIVLDDGRIYSLTDDGTPSVSKTTLVPTFTFVSANKSQSVTVNCTPLINEDLQSITKIGKSTSLPSFAVTDKYFKLKYPLKVDSGGSVIVSGQSAPATVTLTGNHTQNYTSYPIGWTVGSFNRTAGSGDNYWNTAVLISRTISSVVNRNTTTWNVTFPVTITATLQNVYGETLSVKLNGIEIGQIQAGKVEFSTTLNFTGSTSAYSELGNGSGNFNLRQNTPLVLKYNNTVALGDSMVVTVGDGVFKWSDIGKTLSLTLISSISGNTRLTLRETRTSVATPISVTPQTSQHSYTLTANKEINLHVENGIVDGGQYNSDTLQVYLLANGFLGGGDNKPIYDNFGSLKDIGENFRVLMNNAFISGISYGEKGKLGTLLTPMYSVDDTFFPFVVSDGEKKSVIYKATDGLFYEIWHDFMSLSFRYVLARYILFNTTDYLNALDLKTGDMEHIGHDYNSRCLLQGLIGTNEIVLPSVYAFASAVNANYEALNTAFLSTIYNTQMLQGVTTLDVVAVGCNSVLDSIDIYGNTDGNQAMYERSVFFQSGADYLIYERPQLSGTSYPNNTDGNIICAVSMFAEIGNSYFKNVIVKENGVSFLLLRNETMSQFAYLFGTQFGNIRENFVIQGMSYGISDNKIYSLTYDNGVVSNYDIVADITGLQYLGCLPSYAIFWSVQNRHFYIFTGANILQKSECASYFNEITATYYNTGTQVLYLITDKGVCMKTEQGSLILESDFIPRVEQVFFINDDYILIMLDNGMIRLRYTTSDTSIILPLNLETEFYGSGNNAVGVIDSWQITLLEDDKIFSGDLVLRVDTLTDKGMKSEEKVFKIDEKSWDKLTRTLYIRFQPRYQQGMGTRLAIKSPFPITQLAASYTPMATQLSKENV